jgi:hypothetical protein
MSRKRLEVHPTEYSIPEAKARKLLGLAEAVPWLGKSRQSRN